jgi:hypothetical protein
MFSAVRKRLTYANVALTIGLVFAMSGGAYAAGKYLITSTKQISPKVLAQLKGAKGAKGAVGAAGATGPAGPQGPAGAPGVKGETGTQGVPGGEGKPGKDGENGKEGSPWTAGGTLPSKKTEKGAWNLSVGAEVNPLTSISFAIPLAAPISEGNVFYVGAEGKAPECPGSAEEPKAAAGDLCIYQVFVTDVEEENSLATATILDPSGGFFPQKKGAGTTGALLKLNALNGTVTPLAWGTWAVTAP